MGEGRRRCESTDLERVRSSGLFESVDGFVINSTVIFISSTKSYMDGNAMIEEVKKIKSNEWEMETLLKISTECVYREAFSLSVS